MIVLLVLHNPPNYVYLVIHRSNNRNFHFFSFRILQFMWISILTATLNVAKIKITKLAYRDLQKHHQIHRRVLWFLCQWKYRLHRGNGNYHGYQLQIHRIAILERFSNWWSFQSVRRRHLPNYLGAEQRCPSSVLVQILSRVWIFRDCGSMFFCKPAL